MQKFFLLTFFLILIPRMVCAHDYGAVANQTFRNSDFFETHVHLGTLTFQKNQNHKNFLEILITRQRHYEAKTQFTIFSGDRKGSYFAVASGICAVFNRHHEKNGYECIPFESKGSEANLQNLADEKADFGIVKTAEFNKFFVKNFSEFENKINFFAQIHDEYLTILVQKNLRIKSLGDLNEKSVNIGSKGSTSALITEKYFSDFAINPKKIVNFGATESLKMMCDKKIDAWVYFVGHPNIGFEKALEKCDLELISLPSQEVQKFLAIATFFKKGIISKKLYGSLQKNIETIFTPTILATGKKIDPQIAKLVQDILQNHKEELIEENRIFLSF